MELDEGIPLLKAMKFRAVTTGERVAVVRLSTHNLGQDPLTGYGIPRRIVNESVPWIGRSLTLTLSGNYVEDADCQIRPTRLSRERATLGASPASPAQFWRSP